jgi:replication-associated recombination protein RarA
MQDGSFPQATGRMSYHTDMSSRVSPSAPGLFAEPDALKPLAERMRPRSLDEIVGQQRLVGPDKALRRALGAGKIHSMVLWGPPGCGKTTLALLVARYADADFRAISAVLSGLPDVRKALAEAEVNFAQGRRTVLCRMLDGGVDPLYLARRMTRMAVEDVGLAEPRAWRMALDAWDTYERLGSPEGELGLAQLAIWLAISPKSNAAYMAYNKARAAVREGGTLEVPMHLRNAPTKLMKGLGYGKGYQYDHDAEGGIALDQQCLPDELVGRVFYEPVERGLELQLREKLLALRAAREKARSK